MTLDRHNSLTGKGFALAYLGLMALMVIECSAKLPPDVETIVEITLGVLAGIGAVMIALANIGRVEDGATLPNTRGAGDGTDEA